MTLALQINLYLDLDLELDPLRREEKFQEKKEKKRKEEKENGNILKTATPQKSKNVLARKRKEDSRKFKKGEINPFLTKIPYQILKCYLMIKILKLQ